MAVITQPKLVVALDLDRLEAASAIVEQLASLGVWFKVGYEPLYGYGDAIRAKLEALNANVFLDAKMHDIPRTVEAGARALVRPGIRIITVHALGGNEMLQAAVAGATERAAELGIETPEIFAITLLTSIAPEDLGELGLQGGPGENVMRLAALRYDVLGRRYQIGKEAREYYDDARAHVAAHDDGIVYRGLNGGPGENVMRLAALARDARCAGVVCSPHEARDLKAYFGADFKVLCPGIRPAGAAHGDQKRVATPQRAVEAGADYLVVGRPIVGAADPVAAARAILDEMDVAARAR